MLSHYDVLGVEPTADMDAIRRAWRVKVRLLHPDKHRGAPDDVLAEAEKETLQVNRAWDTLGNVAKRRGYDVHLADRREGDDRNGPRHDRSKPPEHGKESDLGVSVACSVCKTTQRVPRTTGRFDCANCKMAWEFAKCDACNRILQVAEHRRTWRCASCGRQQTSSWAGGTRLIFCVRCKSSTAAKAGLSRFKCARCGLEHFRCRGCGEYSTFATPRGRGSRCVRCSRIDRRSPHNSIDFAKQLSFLFSAACCLGLGILLVARMIS
ncbi:MAG: J domain-containing protein [Acidimicrobiia bacterium]